MNISKSVKVSAGFFIGIFLGMTLIVLYIQPAGPTTPVENMIIILETGLVFALLIYGLLSSTTEHEYKVKLSAAIEVNRTKDEFISMVLHHIRTPLTGIKWALREMLKEQNITNVQKNAFIMLEKESDRALDAVIHLIEASQASIGRIKYDFEVYPLSVVRDMAIYMAHSPMALVNQKNITVSVNELSISNAQVKIDKEKLQIVMETILENAIIYTPPGGQVKINMEEKNSQFLISITDTGMGILEKDKPRIFLQFFRGENARRKEPLGFGIGLYLAKIFIEQHNGSISFRSEESKGTTFTVSLPLIILPAEKFLENL